MIKYSNEKIKFIGALYTMKDGNSKDLFFPYCIFPDWIKGFSNVYIVNLRFIPIITYRIIDISDLDTYLFDNYGIKHTTKYCPHGIKYVTPYTLEFDFYYKVTEKGSLLVSSRKHELEHLKKSFWDYIFNNEYELGTKIMGGGSKWTNIDGYKINAYL